MTPLIQISQLTLETPGGRPLFEGLNMVLSRERVALVGRNGVGKSTLLGVLAGVTEPRAGRVATSSKPHLVPQRLNASTLAMSPGELRKAALLEAKTSGTEILLLDEPSEDLDEAGLAWLRDWVPKWPGCVVMASHDRRLLTRFRHFLIASESGSRCFAGTLDQLELELDREHEQSEKRYLQNLNRLAAEEAHVDHVARRKARKKRHGRCSELDRCTPRIRLNQKRSDAQVSHGRLAQLREARLDSLRQWCLSTRRALPVRLSLTLPVPALPEPSRDIVVLRGVSAHAGGRTLFQPLDLALRRQRLAVVGPNGSGKTTLIEILLGERAPSSGSIAQDASKMGAIAQGGANWMLDHSVLAQLSRQRPEDTPEDLAQLLLVHRFPLALAERPFCSLSPGERTRAALICLFRRSPSVELLVLDEPTHSLDLVGQRAMTQALRAWPGGLVVASHDRSFLSEIGTDTWIELEWVAPKCRRSPDSSGQPPRRARAPAKP